MTDVKSLRAQEVVAVEKVAGDKNYAGIYGRLYGYIAQNGYRAVDNAMESFSGSGAGSYEQMKSEIMVPVMKTGEK
jgi:hypothetical protein